MFGAIDLRMIGIALAVSSVFFSGWMVNGWRWSNKYDAYVIAVEKDRQKAAEERRSKEKELQLQADKVRDDKDAQIKSVTDRLNVALIELRKRPLRAASNNHIACARAGSTGAELYREDAEFLTREAARADTIVAERDACYARYNAARALLNGDSN